MPGLERPGQRAMENAKLEKSDESLPEVRMLVGMDWPLCITPLRVDKIYQSLVRGKKGHPFGTQAHWMLTVLMCFFIGDASQTRECRKEMVESLLGEARGPQHGRICKLNTAQQKNWSRRDGAKRERHQHVLHVVVPPNYLKYDQCVESVD